MALHHLILAACVAFAAGQTLTERLQAIQSNISKQASTIEVMATLGPAVDSSLGRLDIVEDHLEDATQVYANVNAKVQALSATVSSVSDGIDAFDELVSSTILDLQGIIDGLIDTHNTVNQQSVKDIEKALKSSDEAISKVRSDFHGETNKALAASNTAAMNTFTTATSGKLSQNRIIWSGGVNGGHGPVNTALTPLNLARVEFNTAADYLEVVSNTRFKAKIAGLYRLNYWGIQSGGNCHGQATINIDSGKFITDHYHNILNWGGNWNDMNVDNTFYIKKDQLFWIQIRSCGHAWHAASQNNPNVYNRVQVEYIGGLATSGNDKCTGPFCLGA